MLGTVLIPPSIVPLQLQRTRVDWLRVAQAMLLVLMPFACYWPALNGAFVWDDDLLITKNPLVLAPDGLRDIWFSTRPIEFHPVTNTLLWVEWRLWGMDPLGYHLVNLALHIVATCLLWRLLRVLRVPGAWYGAVLFAVHPIGVASVAWIAECKTVLAMVFYLGSLVCYAHFDGGSARNRGQYAAALVLHVLALLSKASIVMMPCVLLVLIWWRAGRVRWRDFALAIPFFAASLADGLATMWFQYHRAMSVDGLALADPLTVRLIVAGRTIPFYLGKVLWPHPLVMIYPRWAITAGNAAGYLWPVGTVAMLAGVWWGRRWWGRAPVAALASFVLTLAPVCGLLKMSFFYYSYVSDHLAYAATPGLLALAAAWLTRWYERGGTAGRAALIAMSGIVGLLGINCLIHADDYSGPEKLWGATLEVSPQAFAAHNNYGVALQERGRHEPKLLPVAEAHFREALKAPGQLANAGVNLANVLRMEQRWAESVAVYRWVLAAHPEAESFNNLGVALLEMGDNAGARAALQQAIKLRPGMGTAYYNLYGIELAEKHLPEACALLRECLRIDPNDLQALTALLALDLEFPGQPPLSPLAAETTLAVAEHACQLTQFHGARQLLLKSKAALAAGRRGEAIETVQQARAAAAAADDKETAASVEAFQHSLAPAP